ncbi:MAG: UDP-N-acetylmuramoyl-tripeptide--D-alanyl-D-alanine ligase [Candidatus Pacebacteria bacterium]|nr:UDP-N-acetylmuramoyl-tripeptide--D-alanyl-D-alanine ligase [Candidatus Paceibacterota bacterium]
MKNLFKKIVIFIITWEARLVLIRYRPKIIAVTGSVGKTSTKDAIFTIISKFKTIRKSEKSFNSEIGLPLAILGLPNGWNDFSVWLENIFRGFWLIVKKNSYPEYLVLEVGVGKPGDIIKNVIPWLKPDITVITCFPEKPVHIEFFENVNQIIEEKSALAYATKENGVLILNHDDEKVYEIHTKSKCRTVSYGLQENATYQAIHPVYLKKDIDKMNVISGLNFKIKNGGNTFPVILPNVVGLHYMHSALAAIACACEVGCDLLDSINAISEYKNPPGRLSIIPGINNSIIIDDTYNSSPVAVDAAIRTLSEMKGERLIAVLGDMLELGKFTEEEHRLVGEKIKDVADVLFVVGLRAKLIAEGAIDGGFKKENIYSFDTSVEAGDFLKSFVKPNDILLVKGSQGIHLERAVVAIMAHPEDKVNLLCRQEKEWQNR